MSMAARLARSLFKRTLGLPLQLHGSSNMMSRGGAERADDDKNAPLDDLLVRLDGARSRVIMSRGKYGHPKATDSGY